jgi:hypothetical protein
MQRGRRAICRIKREKSFFPILFGRGFSFVCSALDVLLFGSLCASCHVSPPVCGIHVMGDYDPFGFRLTARLRRESDQVYQRRLKLLTSPVILVPACIMLVIVAFWGSCHSCGPLPPMMLRAQARRWDPGGV